jgi:hypothetical protein
MSKKPSNTSKNTSPTNSRTNAKSSLKNSPSQANREQIDKESKSLPAKLNEIPEKLMETLLSLQESISELLEKQSETVSPEFSALMDGYVNKANESEAIKVRYAHIENLNNEIKEESRNLKDLNRQLHSDLELAREAMRLAESDLHKSKRDFDIFKQQFEDKVNSLTEEKNKLLLRNKELTDIRESNIQEINTFKAEILELKHKLKQSEQERMVQEESHKRSIRENALFIQELKEKVDLRTREVEYKDALLNQLIKQASIEESDLDPNDAFIERRSEKIRRSTEGTIVEKVPEKKEAELKIIKPINASKSNPVFEDGWQSPDDLKPSTSDSTASEWGAFNR